MAFSRCLCGSSGVASEGAKVCMCKGGRWWCQPSGASSAPHIHSHYIVKQGLAPPASSAPQIHSHYI